MPLVFVAASAATLLSKRPTRILRAFKIVPEGKQDGLKPVALRGAIATDPSRDDFFKKVIESRVQVKADQALPKVERDGLTHSLKIIANSGSYGLFVELNPERIGKGPKSGRDKLRVFSGEHTFTTSSEVLEKPGPWYFPIFGSLITAAGRLLLAMLERTVTDKGGTYLFCDTDSMAIVASEAGGLVPCIGGGRNAVKALTWEDVRQIVSRFGRLNPYDQSIVTDSILKIEDLNFDQRGRQRQVYGFAVASKRYALWESSVDDTPNLVKASGHGLGYLFPPTKVFDKELGEPTWVVQAWDWIVHAVVGLPRGENPWFSRPARMRFTITAREVFRALQDRQKEQPYPKQIKPFNFILSAVIDRFNGGLPVGADPDYFTLIAPFRSNTMQCAHMFSAHRCRAWACFRDRETVSEGVQVLEQRCRSR